MHWPWAEEDWEAVTPRKAILAAALVVFGAFALVCLAMSTGALNGGRGETSQEGGLDQERVWIEAEEPLVGVFNSSGWRSRTCLRRLMFYIRISVPDASIDLGADRLEVCYINPRCHAEIHEENGTAVAFHEVVGDGDEVLEQGERFKVVIDFDGITPEMVDPQGITGLDLYSHPGERFSVWLMPSECLSLSIERKIPDVAEEIQVL